MAQNNSSRSAEDRAALVAVTVFPVLIVIAAVWAFMFPSAASHLSPWVPTLLSIIMFGMGLTLTLPDFALVLSRPLPILFGVLAQYVIMPLVAIALTQLLNLPTAVAVGVILVGAAPGGTSSNVISYLAKADVALSVTMTAVSTLLAPIMTPLLVQWLAGTYMDIDGGAMAYSIVKTVVIPVVAGLVLRVIIPGIIDKILPVLPWISTFGICGVVVGVVPGSAGAFATAGLAIFAAVISHNLFGYLLGYLAGKAVGFDSRVCRTMSVEVGMQNSGLAATLAKGYFTPETALPAVIFSVWHNLSGAFLSMFYRRLAERH
ncbi:bile acid:sodium symporter family protein [Trueperella pecoris]|uniref:Bile acid:sodium symporter family protein n=1 Tax=Trueperella pecoris TaxID=2733571 RepID=A0A7M1QZ63_9ACTO|nr:bile acid:sodium symporter family protein [Trueperella pecoris]QOR47238.1 bile acid:sodium symporter family protein [Trueperella pecoris]